MNLTKTNWELGWVPSADNVNGDPNGLLRMDNLQQEENTGAIQLVREIQPITSAFAAFPEKMISRNIDGVETLYVALENGSSVLKGPNLTSFTTLVSGNDHAAMDDCLGQMLICAGNQKKKECNGVVKNLGLAKPSAAPTVGTVNQPMVDLGLAVGSYTLIEGHDLSTNLWYVDKDSLIGTAAIDYGGAIDTTQMGDGTSYDINQDTFSILIQLKDTSLFKKVHVDLIVGGDATDPTDYYSFEWTLDNPQFTLGTDTQSILTCKRKDFKRVGDNNDFNWKTVKFLRVSGEAISDVWILADEARFVGGAKGVLNGYYNYMQVNVYDNSVYQAKSPISDSSETKLFINGYAAITPSTDANASEYWIFRRSAIQVVESDQLQNHLSQWYRVGVSTGGAINDTMSDIDAIRLNVTANEFLMSVQDISDSILDIIGMDGERTLYMTFKYIYLSDRLNPDAIDTRFVLKAFGDTTEKNLWLKQVSNSLRILATTKDLYEISGTLLDNPDGTIDATIRKIGEAFPPLGSQVANVDGGLYYISRDGLRVTNGSNSQNLSPQLAQLFANQNCHGVPPIAITPGGLLDYDICAGRNKIYFTAQLTDGSRRLFVYDIIQKRFRLQFTDPVSLCATGNGKILAGYGGGDPNIIAEVDSNDTSGSGVPFTLLTVFDSNSQPRNRKDTFTLKLVANTGGVNCKVYLGKDAGALTLLGTINSNGETTFYFDLSSDDFTLGFRYQLKITDDSSNVKTFKLKEYTIEYEPRPEQNVYLRIPNTNLGSLARKRFVNFAFVIDTLGNDVTFTPFVDNASGDSSTVNKSAKLTHVHYFTSNTEGTDIGGILQSPTGSPFEFYQLNLEEIISEKLPTPTEYLLVPANDYGTPNRKRFTSYKFQINTRGSLCQITPTVDDDGLLPFQFSTDSKRTVEYFFQKGSDRTGIDIGAIIESITEPKVPFEFYGVIVPQQVEVLPPRLTTLYTPTTNFGVAARKRIRTIPLIIDTYGQDVTFYPVFDGVDDGFQAVFNTRGKTTVFYYAESDVFAVDVFGELVSNTDQPFEFYGYGDLETVEVLPVAKKFDQFQPLRFDKIGKLFAMRIRLIMTGSTTQLPFTVYGDDSPTITQNSNVLFSGTIPVVPNTDNVYEFQFPKNVNGTIFRIVIGPTEDPFHRYDLFVKVGQSGMQSDSQWKQLR